MKQEKYKVPEVKVVDINKNADIVKTSTPVDLIKFGGTLGLFHITTGESATGAEFWK